MSFRTIEKKVAVKLLAAIVVLSWAAVAAFYFLGKPSLAQWTLAVTGAAVITEIAFWVCALMLGVSAIQRRRQLIAMLFGHRGKQAGD